ncbi:MAG: hypothetical protein ACRDPW_10380 [Mycobacteriales bacterium]
MVIASVQPWRDGGIGGGKTDWLSEGNNDPAIATTWEPEPTVQPNRADARTGTSSITDPAVEPSYLYPSSFSQPSQPSPPATMLPPGTTPKAGEVTPLVISAASVEKSAVVGTPVRFDVMWRDGSGYFGELTYTTSGNGMGGVPAEGTSCEGAAPASGGTRTVQHTFTTPGVQTIDFTLSTYNCDGAVETSTVQLTVNVEAAPTTPAPMPPTPTQS